MFQNNINTTITFLRLLKGPFTPSTITIILSL